MSTSTSKTSEEKATCMKVEPTEQHTWLSQLIGEWTYEAECMMGPDQPPIKTTGKESVRSLGGLWTIGNGEGKDPTGEVGHTIFTLGYNPETKRYTGTFVCSSMTHLWIYDGVMDDAKKILTLNADGPDFSNPGKTAHYQDIIEIVSPDHRILRSQVQVEDGKWVRIMTANYKRTGK